MKLTRKYPDELTYQVIGSAIEVHMTYVVQKLSFLK